MTSDATSHVIRLEGPWEVLGFARAGLQPVFHFRGTLDKTLPEQSMEIERLEYSRRFNSPTGLSRTDTVMWYAEVAGEMLGIWLNGEPLQWARNEEPENEVVTECFADKLRSGQNLLECKLLPYEQGPGPFLLHSRLRISPLAKLGEIAD
ncbi:MAG: hypothetical protein ABL888_16010 [Pirellulaceae bacterium]